MDSLSFYYTPIKYKYYLIINLENDTKPYITSVLSGNTNLDKLKNQIMTTLEEEDNNIKEVIEKEIDITIPIPLKSNDTNSIIIVPAVVGDNLIEYGSIERYEFNYINYEENNNNEQENNNNKEDNSNNSTTLIVIFSIIGIILVIIIIIFIIIRRRQKNNTDIENIVLKEDLTDIDN